MAVKLSTIFKMELSLFSAYYTHPEIQVYWEVAKNEKSGFLCVKEKRMKLLVIDIQKGITDSRLFNFEAFIDDTIRIIKAARDNQIEVIYFQHDDGPGTGFSIGDEDFEIAEQMIPKEGEKIFIKNINSCFGNKDFTDYVKDDNTLMIVGLQTNFCIDATVKSAFERGYKVIIPQGANSTFDNDYMTGEETYKYYNDMMWPKRFATCVSVDEAIKLMESSIEICEGALWTNI